MFLLQSGKRLLGGRLTARSHSRKFSSGRAGSIASSPAGSMSQLNQLSNQTTSARLDDVPEDSVMSQQDTGNITDEDEKREWNLSYNTVQ